MMRFDSRSLSSLPSSSHESHLSFDMASPKQRHDRCDLLQRRSRIRKREENTKEEDQEKKERRNGVD